MPELLLELLSEEIPARMQARAAEDLKRLVCGGLTNAGLEFERAEAFVTPRRLALVVDGLPEKQPEVSEERRGPRADAPEKAMAGFRGSLPAGAVVEARETPKGTFLFATVETGGGATIDLLPALIRDAVRALGWPKSMRWGAGKTAWVRPLQRIVCLFDGAAVAFDYAGIATGDATVGHRFLAPDPVAVTGFADYRDKLRAANVILDPAERRASIAAEAERLATAEGLTVRPDGGLLDEVAGLVEWPVVYIGRIDEAFMGVPPEVLITSMRSHQKYFSLTDADGSLAPRFVVVANTETADGGAAVVAGNERVLRARLSDAAFFWDQDRRHTLESRLPKLAERVFHARLGTDLDRAQRIAALARGLAAFTGADADAAERAGRLAKADLTTEMVGEFPELQGTMGRYYARHDEEAADVAEAIAEHYAPQGPNDRCPTAPVGVTVALADKIDTLVGFFGIDEKPTGSKDPFALRRAALGVIRLVLENGIRLPLTETLEAARRLYYGAPAGEPGPSTTGELLDFFADRLKVHLRETGVRHDLISAVFALKDADGRGEDDLVRLLARVEALRAFLDTDDGANLLTAYKRASNIVRIEQKRDGASYEGETDGALLTQSEEIDLHRDLEHAERSVTAALSGERFAEAMAALAVLRPTVDAFFDHVTVNCEDPQLRVNRLKLLSQIGSALGGVADFSHIEG